MKRGKWILEQILGTPAPAAAAGRPRAEGRRTVELDRRRSGSGWSSTGPNPNCATCHARMDPLGFGLENFDAIGAWRDKDGEFPIDASGVLPAGQTFNGPKELKAILMARSRDVHALPGREDDDLCPRPGARLQRPLRRRPDRRGVSRATGTGSRRLVLEIVKSDPFRKRGAEGSDR